MLFVVEYELKPTLTPEDAQKLMEAYGKEPRSPGEVAHYSRIDGSGGYVVVDSDDATALYARVLMFDEWMEFSVIPVLTIEDAVGPILESLPG
jgi:Protein of unknown function (DUF3303)